MTSSSPTLLPFGVRTDVAERQLLRYRAMSFDDKLRIADDLGRLAWELTIAGLRQRHPEFDDAQVRQAARAVFRAATD